MQHPLGVFILPRKAEYGILAPEIIDGVAWL